MAVTGSASQYLGQADVIDANGAEVIDANGNTVIAAGPAVTQTATGVAQTGSGVSGSADQTLPNVTQAAAAAIGVHGEADQTLPDATQTAAGRMASVSGVGGEGGGNTLPNVTQTATGLAPVPFPRRWAKGGSGASILHKGISEKWRRERERENRKWLRRLKFFEGEAERQAQILERAGEAVRQMEAERQERLSETNRQEVSRLLERAMAQQQQDEEEAALALLM